MENLIAHWAEILLATMALIKIFVRLSPNTKDDAVFGVLDRLIEGFVPNRQK
jgi:hypothetical protein